MLRLPLVMALVLAAGCLGSPHAPPADAHASDGLTLTATRVEPSDHAINWTGAIATRLCAPDGSDDCKHPVVGASAVRAGFSWDEPSMGFSDPDGLFWRLDLNISWESSNPFPHDLQFEIDATKPCAKTCAPPRIVETRNDASPMEIRHHDLFLQPGETGILLLLRPGPSAMMATAWGAADIAYHVEGQVASFHAVAPPVVLPQKPS